MAQTVTFTQVYKKDGVAQSGKAWTRYDYKTADGGRFPHFAKNPGDAAEIPLNQAVNVHTSAKGDIKSWQLVGQQPTGGDLPAGNQQAFSGSGGGPASPQNGSQAVTGASGRDFAAEARGKTRCALVAPLLPALFEAQVMKGGDPSPENARVLLDWAFNYVFSEA